MTEIALNGLLLDSPHSGTATYTRGLVPALVEAAPDLNFRLYVREGDASGLKTPVTRLPSVPGLDRLGASGARADKLAWETVLWPAAATWQRSALMHSLYFSVPVVKPAPTVVTVHDVIPLVLQDYHRGPASRMYASLMTRAVRGARAVITVSEHARRDILRTLRVPEERVFVTYEAVDDRFNPVPETGESESIRRRYGLPSQYVVYIGGAERRKNLETLVRAWAAVAPHMRRRDVGLVIVAGFPPPDTLYPDTRGLISELGIERDVTVVSGVSEADKPALLRSALCLCFPSTYEGFGLPPLEGMACGTPVLCSSATSLAEIVGDGGLLLDPYRIEEWSAALCDAVDSSQLRERLRAAGIERATHFSWRCTAERTVDVYRWVLG